MTVTKVRCVGIDAAFANMGFAHVVIEVERGAVARINCTGLDLVTTEADPAARKVVRKSSIDLGRARELQAAMTTHANMRQFAFVEVPSGSQNAGAARGLGIAVGVLASCPCPIIEVSPQEVKQAITGRMVGAQPSKEQMIEWAAARWPDAPWIRYDETSKGAVHSKGRNKGKLIGAHKKGDLRPENEHLADALAAVVAGTRTQEFLTYLHLYFSEGAAMEEPRKPARVRLL